MAPHKTTRAAMNSPSGSHRLRHSQDGETASTSLRHSSQLACAYFPLNTNTSRDWTTPDRGDSNLQTPPVTTKTAPSCAPRFSLPRPDPHSPKYTAHTAVPTATRTGADPRAGEERRWPPAGKTSGQPSTHDSARGTSWQIEGPSPTEAWEDASSALRASLDQRRHTGREADGTYQLQEGGEGGRVVR